MHTRVRVAYEFDRCVERSREGRLAEHFPDVRRVAGLDGQDSASSSEVVFLGDGSSGSEVG